MHGENLKLIVATRNFAKTPKIICSLLLPHVYKPGSSRQCLSLSTEYVTPILIHTLDSQIVAMQYVQYCLQCWSPADILGNSEVNDK